MELTMQEWDALKREEQYGMMAKIFKELEDHELRLRALEHPEGHQ